MKTLYIQFLPWVFFVVIGVVYINWQLEKVYASAWRLGCMETGLMKSQCEALRKEVKK